MKNEDYQLKEISAPRQPKVALGFHIRIAHCQGHYYNWCANS